MNTGTYIRKFDGISRGQERIRFSQTQYGDYSLFLHGENQGDVGHIVLGGSVCGGVGFMDSRLVRANALFLSNEKFRRAKQFERLPSVPILLAHEHRKEDGERFVIFQKITQNQAEVLRIRFVQFVSNILHKDFSVIACKSGDHFQRDLFEENWDSVRGPIFMTARELDEIAHFLESYLRFQMKHYQESVNNLLAKLPSE